MIREIAIQALDGLVGFRQPINPTYAILDTDNLISISGLRFEDATGFVSIQNIIETYEYETLTTSQKNDVLDDIRHSAARDILNFIFQDKSKIIESKILYEYEQNYQNTWNLDFDFNFIELTPLKDGISFNIGGVWLSFDADDTFNIYLYNSTKIDPIQTEEATIVGGESTFISLNWDLDSIGTYRLGYKTSEVSGNPYKRDYEMSSVDNISKFIDIEYKSADFSGGRLDLDTVSSNSDSFGLNIEYSCYVDWTKEIIKNKHLFARALQLQLALTVADRIISSNNSNIIQRMSNDAIKRLVFTINGNSDSNGLKGKLQKELDNIKNFFFPDRKIFKSTKR